MNTSDRWPSGYLADMVQKLFGDEWLWLVSIKRKEKEPTLKKVGGEARRGADGCCRGHAGSRRGGRKACTNFTSLLLGLLVVMQVTSVRAWSSPPTMPPAGVLKDWVQTDDVAISNLGGYDEYIQAKTIDWCMTHAIATGYSFFEYIYPDHCKFQFRSLVEILEGSEEVVTDTTSYIFEYKPKLCPDPANAGWHCLNGPTPGTKWAMKDQYDLNVPCCNHKIASTSFSNPDPIPLMTYCENLPSCRAITFNM